MGLAEQLLQERLGKEFKLEPAVKPEAAGSLQALLPLSAQNVPNPMLAVDMRTFSACQRTGKGFSTMYVFRPKVLTQTPAPVTAEDFISLRPHMSWKTTNVANWKQNSQVFGNWDIVNSHRVGPNAPVRWAINGPKPAGKNVD